ncbi:MAG: hypothetical protein FIB08_01420 [Candidatus Methanoperedens sp.]|nr:hypothetical protein [Candidatus Methanoperedens sp.]
MDLFICSHCGANLIECGITEVTVGGVGKMDISFAKNGSEKEIKFGDIDVHDFDDQWVVCALCGAELHDRTAIEIIEAFRDGLPHIRNECSECGKTFGENICDGCGMRAGQCTGVRVDNDLCQECCMEEFKCTTLINPVAFVASESS